MRRKFRCHLSMEADPIIENYETFCFYKKNFRSISTVNLLFFVCVFFFYFEILWSSTYMYLWRLKLAMHNVFLCKFYICKCLPGMLNLQVIKFVKINFSQIILNLQ